MPRPLYRARQFWRAINAQVTDGEVAALGVILSPRLLALFRSMPIPLQRHHLNVYNELKAAGCSDREVLTAALLHDVGKGRISVWVRVLHVLLEPTPGLRAALADPSGQGWRGMLFRSIHHPRLGALLALDAGASDTAAWLIEHQDERPEAADPALRAQLLQLQAVDNRN